MTTLASHGIGSGRSARVAAIAAFLLRKAREFDAIAVWARAAVDNADRHGAVPGGLKLDTLR